jgi:light-regulated signal transduction histidine kinase (bacteriophytochrome)
MFTEKTPAEIGLLDQQQQFLQSALHDLRAQQRGSGIAAELLMEASGDGERAVLVKQILHGLSKTEELLTAIGSYATVLPPGSYSAAVFPLASAIRFAITNLDREIRESNATISVGELPEILGDRHRLADLFAHLLSNSIKFRGVDAPAVDIAARRSEDGWLVSVADNGIGIPQKYRERLFIPFRRLHGAEIPGVGLGLATARKIAEAHGGRIWIEGPEGTGVTFAVLLRSVNGA